MNNSVTNLRYFLKEMFQFNENDLDFGISTATDKPIRLASLGHARTTVRAIVSGLIDHPLCEVADKPIRSASGAYRFLNL